MSGQFPNGANARLLAAEAYAQLKAATRRLIKKAGGVEAAAQVTRVGRSVLGDYGNANKPECFAAVDAIADLERDVADPIVTRCLASLAGYQLTAIASPSCGASDLHSLLTAVTADLGDAARAVVNMDSDGKRTAGEIRQLQGQSQELLSAAQRLADAVGRLSTDAVGRLGSAEGAQVEAEHTS